MSELLLFDSASLFQVTITINDSTLAPESAHIVNSSGVIWTLEYGHPNRAPNRTFSRDFTAGEVFDISFPAGIRNNVTMGDVGPYRYSAGPR